MSSLNYQKEYSDLYKIITNQQANTHNNNDIYTNLMSKETKYIKLLNNVVNDVENIKRDDFLNTPIYLVPINIIKTLNGILQDILQLVEYTPSNFHYIFTKEHRIIYLGILFILIALLLMLINMSDN